MLIIPVTDKISWRNPPIITISLVLINCIIFFLFQFNQYDQYADAEHYYVESGLMDIEVNKYIDYKYTAEQREVMAGFSKKKQQRKRINIYRDMRRDQAFMLRLEQGKIIAPGDPDYTEWKNLRNEYKQKRSRIFTIRFGFKPANPSLLTMFTYMFLHGSLGHLIGNMIFLWLVGCLLETGCGRIYYFTTYIVTGLGAAGMFWFWTTNTMGPLVGASGAIAGLMGAFTVLYGRKKMRIFYSIGIYFNYIRIRAIILLPLWIGNEIYQLVFSEMQYVAYLAHIGGLLSGALLGFINKKYLGFYKEDAIEVEPEDEILPLLEKALAHMGRLEMEEGAKLLNEILNKDPENISALKPLFDIYKTQPDDAQFHDLTKRFLLLLSKDSARDKMTIDVYNEYVRSVTKTRLSAVLYLRLISIFSAQGQPEKAEPILAFFLKKKPDLPGLAAALLKLANGYKKTGNYKKQRNCFTVLCKKFSDTPEALLAKNELKGFSND